MKERISGTTAKGIPLINENNVADINQVNESLQKIDELLGNNQELNLHKNLSIISENGVHNLKYDPITKSFYYNQGGEWLAVELEGTGNVSVSGLTAGVLKTGVTAIIKQGEKEVKRITGTFTNDATATAADIVSGKTAYVNGNKITGNMQASKPIAAVAFTANDTYVGITTVSADDSLLPGIGHYASAFTGYQLYFGRNARIYIEDATLGGAHAAEGAGLHPNITLNGNRIYKGESYYVNSNSFLRIESYTRTPIYCYLYLITEII